ncbi:hypothetical protein ACFVH6_01235 [Spirillospora sp. NPDC127200]
MAAVAVAVGGGFAVAGPAAIVAADTGTTAKAASAASASAKDAGPGYTAQAWSARRSFSSGRHPQCRGYYQVAKPWKSGRYIKAAQIIHCNSGGWGRRINTRVDLQQYRGVGIWRNKATVKHTDNNASHAYTKTLTASWKCSGGSQLYRPQGSLHVYSVTRGSQTATLREHRDEARIRC